MSAAGPLDPDRLAAAEFSTAFRGYDTGEVRALLMTVGTALREAAEREHELREQLARAEHHLRELRETTAAQVEEAAEEARREGREMVAEAQRVRERMLGDLARRRRNARQQVEQLMAGRERLLEAFDSARQTIDAATQDMRGALPEARLAAEAAGRRFDQEVAGEDDEVAVAALEEEIEAARLVGLPLVAAATEAEAAPAEAGGRNEPSLLGERDVREMPPVELGADFEDVRIVPVEASVEEAATEGAPTDEGSAAEEEAERDRESPAGEGAVDEPVDDAPGPDEGDEAGPGEPEPEETAAVVETDEDAEVEAVEDDEVGDAVVVDEAPGEDVEGDEAPPVDPAHLDDLFASLRAARAEAVTDARSVLSREDGDADEDDASEGDVDPAEAAAPVVEAEPASEAAPAEEPVEGTDEPPVADEPEPEAAVDEVLAAPPHDEAPADADVSSRQEQVDEPAPTVAVVAPVDVDQAVTAAGDRLASALKRVLANEQNELLDRLRQVGRNERADSPGVLGDPTDLAARFAAAAHEPLAAVAATAMASMAPDGRARPPAVDPLATAAATELVEPLQERLARGFAEAGTDVAEASALARATFREWKTRRIGICASDAARGAFHAGLLAGVSRSTTLVWALDDEETACPECADNALAGPVGRGERYPTGHRHPPAHDGCRCTLVVAEEPTG